MKTAASIILLAAIALLSYQIRTNIVSAYKFEKSYKQLWELADKSSTIAAKQKYIGQFVAALQNGYANGEFASHNAIWLATHNNSFEANLTALKSLSDRLIEIQDMKPSSFEYNTAIQQITAQEQGEANAMLDVFGGCYELSNYPLVWGWIGGTLLLIVLLMLLLGFVVLVES